MSESSADSTGKTIVVCVDDSPMSNYALEWASKLVANKETDHIRLLHVQTPSEHVDEIHEKGVVGPLYKVGKELSEEAMAIVSTHLAKCKQLGLLNYREEVIIQTQGVGKSIVAYVRDLGSLLYGNPFKNILLVVGTRELGFFQKAFLGSVSEYCVNNCHCPVLVCKMPVKERK